MIKPLFNAVLIFLVYASLCYGCELEVYFFDVGQGCCTFVKSPCGPPLIVDGGSTAYSYKGISKEALTSRVSSKIKEALPEMMQDIDLNVVISHGDIDHYNLIPDFLPLGEYNGKKINLILGGQQSHYKDSSTANYFCSYLGQLLSNGIASPIYTGLKQVSCPIDCGEEVKAEILEAPSGKLKSNEYSIIVQVTYGNKSAILTGDAPGNITDKLIKSRTEGNICKLTTDILQANHHGADTHDSNNALLFTSLNPLFVIFSAGLRQGGFTHPTLAAAERALQYSSNLKSNEVSHRLTCAKGTPHQDNHLNFGPATPCSYVGYDNYYSYEVTYGLYNTHDSGDVIFSWSEGDEIVNSPKCSNSKLENNTPSDGLSLPLTGQKESSKEEMIE